MVTWRNRVKITALALASAVGTWIVYDNTRERLKVVDEAEFAEATMERYAALTYSADVATVVGWTSVRYATNGTSETWGGFSNVVIDIAEDAMLGDGNDLDGTYTYAYQARTFEGFAADRGWMDVYTNGALALLDLGPSGGGHVGRRVGGWALTTPGEDYTQLALPRGFGLSSAWFMEAYFTPELLAFGYDPADNAATPGGIDPARRTYWEPGAYYTVTNEAAQTPLRQDRWYSGTPGYSYLTWHTENYATPLVVWPTIAPMIDGYLADQIDDLLEAPVAYSVPRSYVDYARASAGLTDFDGWASENLPHISTNAAFMAARSNWVAFVESGETAIKTRAAYEGLGRALMDLQSVNVEAYWTTKVGAVYCSKEFTNSAAGWADLLANPGWHVPADPEFSPPVNPGYELFIVYRAEGIGPCRLAYRYTQAAACGMLGRGHNTNAWDEATAHYYSTGYATPEGETIIEAVTNQMVRLSRESGMSGPLHAFSVRPPAYTNAPPLSYFPTLHAFTNTWTQTGYELGAPIVVAAPVWDVPRIE